MNRSMEDSIFIAKRGNKLPYFDFSIFSNPYEKGCAISSRACCTSLPCTISSLNMHTNEGGKQFCGQGRTQPVGNKKLTATKAAIIVYALLPNAPDTRLTYRYHPLSYIPSLILENNSWLCGAVPCTPGG